MSFIKLGAEIFRDYETSGVPASGAHKIVKSDVRDWMAEVERQVGTANYLTADWATSTAYSAGDIVWHNSADYQCTVPHTSGASTEPGTGASWTSFWQAFAPSLNPTGNAAAPGIAFGADPNTGFYRTTADTIDVALGGARAARFASAGLTLGVAGTLLGALVLSGNTSGTTTLQPAAAASGTLTLPATTDTLVGRNTTDTLTNKTLTSPSLTGTPTAPTATSGTNTTQIATTAFVLATRLDQFAIPTVSVSFNSQRITSVADPSSAQDAATKAYVDSVAQGLDAKPSVKCATTANITLSGEQTIDGVTTSASRVLVKNQSTASQNGIYVSGAGSWTRATDADSWTELLSAFVFVEEGTVNADTGWTCTNNSGGTLGSTSVTWTQFSGAGTYTAGTGLLLSGTQFTIDTTVATLTGSQTLTNKTLTAPIISTISNTGTLTLPTSTDTLVGRATTDTLSNKTLASPIFTGTVDVQQAIKWTGYITPTTLSGSVDDYAPTGFATATVLRIDGGAADRNITGFSGGAAGRIVVVHNIGATNSLILKNETTSTNANRLLLGGDITIGSNQTGSLIYDATTGRWRALAVPGSGGGGGSVSTTYPLAGTTSLTYTGPFECGRLTYVSATAVKFAPYNGDLIRISGVVYQIPSAGIAGVANTSVFVNGTGSSNLASNTVYDVFAFNNSGTITADFCTPGHSTSSTAGNIGTEIKTGDDTRTLIGKVRTNGSSQFVDSATQRFVLSWFNRRRISTTNVFSANRNSTTTSTYTEVNSEIRNEFLVWSGETVDTGVNGSGFLNTSTDQVYVGIAFNGASPEDGNLAFQGTLAIGPLGMYLTKSGLTEGYNYSTISAKQTVGSGAFTFVSSATGQRCSLSCSFLG